MNYGIPMVGDEVRLLINTEATNLDRKKQEEIKKTDNTVRHGTN